MSSSGGSPPRTPPPNTSQRAAQNKAGKANHTGLPCPSLLYEALFPAAIRRKWHSHGIAENECAMPPQTPGPQGFESKWHRWHSTFCNIGIYIITLRGKRYAFLLCHLCHFPCNRWAPALSRGIAETVCTVPPPGHLCHFSGTASSAPSSAAFPLPVGRKGGKVACRSATFPGKFQPPGAAMKAGGLDKTISCWYTGKQNGRCQQTVSPSLGYRSNRSCWAQGRLLLFAVMYL